MALGPDFVALSYANDKQGARAAHGEFVNVKTGEVVDTAGRLVTRLESRDDDRTQLYADYCASYYHMRLAQAVGHPVTMTLADGSERVVKMDLGQGDVHIDSALPNYAAGYKLGTPVADLASPPLLVAKASDKFNTWDAANAFQRVLPTGGAPGAVVPEINPSLSNATFSTTAYALAGFLPMEVIGNADAPLKPQQAVLRRIMNALLLEREIRVSTMLTTSGNWDASVVQTIAAGSQWNGGASSDPVKNIQDAIQASYLPVTGIVMSEKVRFAFARNPKVQSYVFAKPDPSRPLNIDQLQAVLDLPPITVAKMKYLATPSSSNALSYVWGNDVILLHSPEQNPPTDQEDVATSYTFRWTGAGNVSDGSMQGGFLVRQYFDPRRGPRAGNVVVATHNDAEQMTSKFVGGLLINAFQ